MRLSRQVRPRRLSAAAGGLARRLFTLAAFGLVPAVLPQIAAAQPPADPDWPCVQRKVASLSPASMWPGLSEATLNADWRADPEVAALVAEIAPRRVPVEEAEEAIRSFAAGLGEDRQEKLTLLFLGLFQTLDAERSDVVRGIERFAGHQRRMAERILADRADLAEAHQGAAPNPAQASQRREELAVAIRVYEDRRQSLAYVCEVPRVIEQRLFGLTRTIRAELSE